MDLNMSKATDFYKEEDNEKRANDVSESIGIKMCIRDRCITRYMT